MKILYSFFIGMVLSGAYCLVTMLFGGGGGTPQMQLTFISVLFVIGCIIGWIDACKKEQKKAEEDERQAEHDRTNELMRQYLEKKLREEEENGE